jgi:pyruvate dehydrogenase E2 component (dihydrolipoamide acetyltransferase)
MAFEFRLADLAEGMVEGEVVRWMVNEGDPIKEDQPLVEVMTDKATVEIASPKAGTIAKIHAPAGQVCKVGAILVVIDEAGAAKVATAAAAPVVAPSGVTAAGARTNGHSNGSHGLALVPPVTARGGKVLATPATRKLARDLGIDLSTVRATGDNGRVTKEDVHSARSGGAVGSVGSGAATAAPAPTVSYAPLSTARDAADERVPFRGVRKKIAENMHRSKHTAAHFTYVEECDVTELASLRKRAKARAEERGIKLSFLPFIVKAVCAGLKKFPIVNSTLDEATQEIVLRKRYHVGVAAASEAGLIVPVLKDADQKSLFQIASELDALSEKAKLGKATREDLTGSTFTISSLGTLGGVLATPIINFPEVAILGVHKIKPTPVVRDGQIVIRDMMNLSISLDHRIVDGYEGAQFLQHVVRLLEDPTLMFMEMV